MNNTDYKNVCYVLQNLVKKPPNLSKEKLKVLEKLLSHENHCVYEDCFQTKFTEENIECKLNKMFGVIIFEEIISKHFSSCS